MIRALIVDDENHCIVSLRKDIELCLRSNPTLTASKWEFFEAENIPRAAELIKSVKPDLVFLDINLETVGAGFRLLKLFPEPLFSIIFVTGHDEYAVRAFEFSGLHYLLKPVVMGKLEEALHRFMQKRREEEILTRNLLHNLSNQVPKISFSTREEGVVIIHMHEIICCEADNNHTHFHLKNQNKHTSSKTLKVYDGLLTNYQFCRVHQSFLVNMDFVLRFDSYQNHLILKNKLTIFSCGVAMNYIPVSKSGMKEVKHFLEHFAGK